MRLCAALGVALGLDLLAKGTAITVAPVIAAAVVLGAGWRDWRGLLMRGVAIGIPAVLLSAPWYLFLYRTYGDFSGLARVEELQYWNGPMGSFFELLTDPDFIMNRFRETWGEFGWRQIHLRPELLWAIAIPTILALVGLAVYAFSVWRNLPSSRGDPVMRPEAWQRNTLIILFLTCVVAYLAVVQFGTSFALSQARYYFPAINAGALLLMLGLRTLLPGRARPAGQGIVFGALVAAQHRHHDRLRAAVHGNRRRTDRDLDLGWLTSRSLAPSARSCCTLPAEAPAEAVARPFPALPRSLMILWAGLVLATGGFLVTGRLRIGAGNWIGRRMPAREIWSRFLGFLTDHGASGPLILLVTAAAIMALVIAAVAFWLALALRDAPPESAADTSAEM